MSDNTLPATIDPQTGVALLTVADQAAIHDYALAEKSPATRRAYRSDFAAFTAWCAGRALAPIPAAPETVAAFIADQANAGFRSSTLGRRVAAIAYAHGLAGLEPPTNSKAVRVVLGGARRKIGTRPAQKAPATAERIAAMLAQLPDTLTGKRDRALLALGFAGAFRRSELVALELDDLAFEAEGVRIYIRHSKTDQEGRGQEIAVPRGTQLQPVKALQNWLRAGKIEAGPVFRSIDRHGRTGAALSAQSVALIVKRHAETAGLDPHEFAGHSLRAGFLTSAAEAGADVLRMMEVSRHKRVETVQGYVRRANGFKGHAGERFL
ncbi:MAG: tyrosine-type recombinase/integrase [Janthinobacterium lividum]